MQIKGTACMECHVEMGPETVNNKVQFMESTALEKYKEKLCRGKKVKMQKFMNIKIALKLYFLFSILSSVITSAV